MWKFSRLDAVLFTPSTVLFLGLSPVCIYDNMYTYSQSSTFKTLDMWIAFSCDTSTHIQEFIININTLSIGRKLLQIEC